MKSSQIIPLLPDDHEGIMEVKWCKNRMFPFLALNPELDPSPKPKDDEGNHIVEETIRVYRNLY